MAASCPSREPTVEFHNGGAAAARAMQARNNRSASGSSAQREGSAISRAPGSTACKRAAQT
ncbi:hypothetical protein D3C71_1682890 [compost metagenome]